MRKDIPARLITISLPKYFERFFIKLKLCQKKMLCDVCTILQRIAIFLILVLSREYWIATCLVLMFCLVTGDLNSEISEMAMSEFCET